MAKSPPDFSVVLCTYNRAQRLPAVLTAVLAQEGPSLELVIVDDGSADETRAILSAVEDPRAVVIHQENRGLCAARNVGLGASRGEWVVFLDDDDLPLQGWLEALVPRSEAVAYTCTGGHFVDKRGLSLGARASPFLTGGLYGHRTIAYLPGLFAMRRSVLQRVGGYLEGLGSSHQMELALRVLTDLEFEPTAVQADDRDVLAIERRAPRDRPVVNPRDVCDGSRWVLERYPLLFASDKGARADMEGVVGVSASRLGELETARKYLWRSFKSQPGDPRRLARAAIASVPGAARRVWGGSENWSTYNDTRLGVIDQTATQGRDELFLPWRYQDNPLLSDDAGGHAYWADGGPSNDVRLQDPVYRVAADLVRTQHRVPVVDIGCGSGVKLVSRIGGLTDDFVGVDQPSGIASAERLHPGRRWLAGDLEEDSLWTDVTAIGARLAICSDVIEHLAHPARLLRRIRDAIATDGALLISTPDRAVGDGRQLGPPRNLRHVREWSDDGLELLLMSVGFRVVRRWHLLPRAYSWRRTELNRIVYRAIHLQRLPDRRSCMVMLAVPRTT